MDPLLSSSGITPPKKHFTAAENTGKNMKNYDQIEFSERPEGTQKKFRELVGHISQEIRIRPSRSELSTIQKQIQEGSYRCDPYEIAARMLLMK